MGSIARFDVHDLRVRYGLKYFVETGTGEGNAIAEMLAYPFMSLLTCEFESILATKAIERFDAYRHVYVFEANSVDFLAWACRALPYREPALFWLDAHFPGADYGIRGYDARMDDQTRLPLAAELEIIARNRPDSTDVIAIDDLRIYKDGPFGHGNLPEGLRPVCPKERNIDFVHDIMGRTHDVTELYDHEGYILLTPKVPIS